MDVCSAGFLVFWGHNITSVSLQRYIFRVWFMFNDAGNGDVNL